MRKAIMIVLALALLAGSASAKLGDLVASFPNVGKDTSHYGLAADGNNLYSFYELPTWRYPVIVMKRTTGSFVSSYPIPGATYRVRGLCYDGMGCIYGSIFSPSYVARFESGSGSLISTWTWPSGTRYAICVDHKGTSGGTYIYQSYYNGDFWKSSLGGSLVSSWSMPTSTNSVDHAWDYKNKLIWCVNYSTLWISGINPDTHKIVASFQHPRYASISNAYGIAYWPDYLYVSNSRGAPDEYIWVFDCPNTVGMTPASVGKVKALFK